MRVTERTNEYTRRALSYFRAISQAERRFSARTLYRLRLQSMAEGLSARPLGTVSGGSQTGRENIMARLTDLDRDLAKELSRLQAIREQTWDLFSRLSHPKAGQVLEEFYLNDIPLHVIAMKIGYGERHTYYLKEKALQELGKLLGDKAIVDPQPAGFVNAPSEYMNNGTLRPEMNQLKKELI